MDYFGSESLEGREAHPSLEKVERLLYGVLEGAIKSGKPDLAREWVFVMQRLGIV